MAALEAAMMVKSLPVIPSSTSLPIALHISSLHLQQAENREAGISHSDCGSGFGLLGFVVGENVGDVAFVGVECRLFVSLRPAFELPPGTRSQATA